MYKLLDLFCGAGGAGYGYHKAGYEVTGVDIKPMPRYPFEFHQADALEYLATHGHKYDVIHASPPCQRFSVMTKRWGRQNEHPDYIQELRNLLIATGKPYIIENVKGALLNATVMLCGSMFGLPIRRHRYFETNFFCPCDRACDHGREVIGVYGHTGGSSKRDGKTFATLDTWRKAMGIDWMIGSELSEAIPPAYTEYIGHRLSWYLVHTHDH